MRIIKESDIEEKREEALLKLLNKYIEDTEDDIEKTEGKPIAFTQRYSFKVETRDIDQLKNNLVLTIKEGVSSGRYPKNTISKLKNLFKNLGLGLGGKKEALEDLKKILIFIEEIKK